MAKRKAAKVATPANIDEITLENDAFFPFAHYTSIVGVHTSLLLFTTFYFPRMFEVTGMSQTTSLDRPQHPLMVSLTAWPPLTVASICSGAVVLQSWWGGWIRDWMIDYSSQGSDERRRIDKSALDQRKLQYIRNAWLATLASSFVFHAALVLFGAPILHYAIRTYLLALLLSILTVFTPAYTYGIPSFRNGTESMVVRLTWVRLFSEFSMQTPVERAIAYPSVGAIVGCWLGAIPIALDWDRPWQAWPLTPMFGCILGYIVASLAALTASATASLAQEGRRQHLKAL